MKQINSKSGLAIALSKLELFEKPKVRLEQYPTDSEVAATVLWEAHMKEDIKEKVSADLGCGTGILGIGILLLGARKVIFIDKDNDAINLAKSNLKKAKSEYNIPGKYEFICKDIKKINIEAETIIQNPPFGVKVRHADRPFLKKSFETAKTIYSFHKSDSKRFVKQFSKEKGFIVTNIWDFKFPLKASYEYHSKRIKRIEVSCFRLQKATLSINRYI